MLVDHADGPTVVGSREPRFSWEVPLAGRNRRQSAYRVLVASCPELLTEERPDLWDSGRVESSRSVDVPYGGRRLESDRDCWWTVQLWDESGSAVPVGKSACFSTPLLDAEAWQAHWIGLGDPDEPVSDPATFQQDRVAPEVQAVEPDPRSPMLRQVFVLDRPLRRARAYVCGLGLFELRCNGRKVGDDVLATPRTDFRKRVLYRTHDVTALLQPGVNAIGLMLGNGWFNGQKKYWGWQMQWYGSPRAILQLEIECDDGSSRRIVSDESWRGAWSPITASCIYDGECFDGRLEQDGWDRPDFDDGGWQSVRRVASPGGRLAPMVHEPEQITETMHPVAIHEPQPGVYVADLGRNITGWVRLTLMGGERGRHVTLRYAEAVHPDASLNPHSNGRALQTDTYICRGAARETYAPRFTFHGFQYVEISGLPAAPSPDDIVGCFARVAVAETGTFDCASSLITTIHRCTLQSQRCNIQMGVPTDDTQRPERLGWGADAWGTATEALYNLWMPRLYAKWIGDFRDQQDEETGMVGMITPQAGAEEDLVWSAAFPLVPWLTYLHCGDRRILEDNYPALRRYLDFLARTGTNTVANRSSEAVTEAILWRCGREARFPRPEDRGHLQLSQWGDHLSTAEGFVTRANQPLSVATAFYYLDAVVMAKIAAALGHDRDADAYRELAAAIKEAFNQRFLDRALGYYDNGSQSAQAWPLAFGLVPEEERQRVEQYLVGSVARRQRRLTTGYVGTRFAIQALAEAGRSDLVWERATATDFPSWGYMLRRGRTTSCEQWDGESGSLNHAPLGAAIDEWFYWGLAGIRPDESAPGFERIVLQPYLPADLEWVRASVRTVRGRVRSAWRKEGGRAFWEVTVPANCSATVHVPTGDPNAITESDQPLQAAPGISVIDHDDAVTRLAIGSGSYRFAFPC